MIAQFVTALNEVSAAWWEVLAPAAWQSALLILAASVLCLLLRRQPPAARFWIWTIVAAKLLLMPGWSYTLTVPEWMSTPAVAPAQVAISPSVDSIAEFEPQLAAAPPLPPSAEPMAVDPAPLRTVVPRLHLAVWLMLAWAVVVLLQLGRIFWQWRNLRALLARGRPADAALTGLVEHLSRTIGLRRPPAVLVVPDDVSPLVARARHPVLVLARALVDRIERAGLRQIVLHELAHVRRGDLWWCWLPQLARTVYWFHPLVHWVAYQANLERELACDAAAIGASEATVAQYAHTLVDAASRATPLPALQAAVNQLVGE